MENSKNLLLACVLSVIVLAGWQFYYVKPKLEAQQQAQMAAQKEDADSFTPKADPLTVPTEPAISITEATTTSPRITLEGEDLGGSINLKGARFDELYLKKYHVSTKKDAPQVTLLSPSQTEKSYFAEFGWVGSGIAVPNSKTLWQADKTSLSPGNSVTLNWDNQQGQRFFLTVSLDKHYLFTIQKRVENYGATPIALAAYGLIQRRAPRDSDGYYILHEGPLGVFNNVLEEITYDDLIDDGDVSFPKQTGWLGVTDKYWLTAIIPSQETAVTTRFTSPMRGDRQLIQSDYVAPQVTINAGASYSNDVLFFAGAKKVTLLDDYKEQHNIPLFDRAVDFGWLYFITKPMFTILNWLHHIFGSFGLGILMLTVLLKIALFPLANKSYVSMHKMKQLTPKMTELKERYKDNKMELNQKLMALYREEKVNPAAGCLPMLIQIPIFFALYKVLFVTIEMRHTPFYGWIDDLSAPDPTSIFNMFGLLPWEVPFSFTLGAWPIIMGLTMIIQQKLNPKPTDPVQAKVMGMMPYFFIFLFATFPAGLIIYWAWSNTLSILQQWFISRRLEKKTLKYSQA